MQSGNFNGRHPPHKIAAHEKLGFPHHWKYSKVHAGPRFRAAFGLPYVYDYVIKLFRQQADVIQNHENKHVRSIGQGEARRRKYKRLKLGVRPAYDRSSN
jgi:hypothetical protein